MPNWCKGESGEEQGCSAPALPARASALHESDISEYSLSEHSSVRRTRRRFPHSSALREEEPRPESRPESRRRRTAGVAAGLWPIAAGFASGYPENGVLNIMQSTA